MLRSVASSLGKGTREFLADESGNAVVDWVVLTASVVVIGVLVMMSIGGGVTVFSKNAEVELSDREITNH